ncbi:hypothetical protein OIU77_010249 [Salix suchowensis]|uniref:Uncharacterized protein n=1 Tax=Salix suchowensis TaxID=1278906 RepID=A0ABQ9A878_9ROSI|nr:hypothetical protein OIU77_010249 [Salix suchowensis]
MSKKKLIIPSLANFLIFILLGFVAATEDEQKEFYIVYLGDQLNNVSAVQTHLDVLLSIKSSDFEARESIVYSYTKIFNAFAAKLSKAEARKLSRREEVLSVFPNRYHKLHTTKSWDFIGLPNTTKRNLKMERNMVVGLLDTGITPKSESFKDDGFGPPPKKWKGTCGHYANFSGCNNKLVGARYFKLDGKPDPSDILSPVDVDGHGTHTSSTLAGNLIPDAHLFGLARGAARGAVPNARVAMYKVCWMSSGCSDMDLLAGFEAAIHDGVDVLSISIGGVKANYVSDALAIGAFHAMKKGIITVASGGNDGPSPGSVANHAPWILTVAASGINREFRSKVELGNGKIVSGVGVNTFQPKQKSYPLVSGADAGYSGKPGQCKELEGKALFLRVSNILILPKFFMAPATMVNATISISSDLQIPRVDSPCSICRFLFISRVQIQDQNAFSSLTLQHQELTFWHHTLSLRSLTGPERDFHGLPSRFWTSCLHKVVPSKLDSSSNQIRHPDDRVNNDAEFAYGAGQINPIRARNPGLVYDMDEMSYIQFLCREGYNESSLAVLVGSKSINCSSLLPGLGHDALNYPTMQLQVKNEKEPTTGVFIRTVTNVGPSPSFYNAAIKAPKGSRNPSKTSEPLLLWRRAEAKF